MDGGTYWLLAYTSTKAPVPLSNYGGGQLGWSLRALEALWPEKGVSAGPRKADPKEKVPEPDSKLEAGK